MSIKLNDKSNSVNSGNKLINYEQSYSKQITIYTIHINVKFNK